MSHKSTAFRRGRTRGFATNRFHDIAYVEWGDPRASATVVCVHGLTRQGRDFDQLAQTLAKQGYRVVCPDVVGRGHSGWLKDPELYALPQYVSDMTVLIGPQIDLEGRMSSCRMGNLCCHEFGDKR